MANRNYDQYVGVSDQGTKKVLRDFQSILPKLDGKKIIDIGCGTGLLLDSYTKNNEVIGIDNNKISLAIAKKKGIKTKQVDLEQKLPFKSNTFDLVICKDVLEFIFNAEQLLSEIIRITKPNGQILLHVPNEFSILDQINLLFGQGILKTRWYTKSNELNNPHIRFFTNKSLVRIFQEKGLRIENDYSSNWVFSVPVLNFKPYFLSKISSRLFSPGITLLCKKAR